MVKVRPKGWQAVVTEPSTSRDIPAEVLDDPQIRPSLNSLPRIRIPVPTSDIWQQISSEATFTVYKDGAEQPIDELTKPIDPRGRAHMMLDGRGGVELLDEVSLEYDSKLRDEAAKEVIQNHTTYADDVPAPSTTVNQDQTMQDHSTTTEFQNNFSIANDVPIGLGGDTVTLQQAGFGAEAENATNSFVGSTNSNADASNGSEVKLFDAGNPHFIELDFTTDYVIPEANLQAAYRFYMDSATDNPGINVKIDGTTIFDSGGKDWTVIDSLNWNRNSASGDLGGDLSAGSHTLRIEVDQEADGGEGINIDYFVVYDDRHLPDSTTWDNTVDANGFLEDPKEYPGSVEIEGSDATTAFAIEAGAANLTIDDTTGTQRLQVSNDRGSTWLPSNGDEDNTASVDVTFADVSDRIRLRFRLSRYGSRTTATPTVGFNGQEVSDYELLADIRQESLLLDYSETQSIQDHLTEIVGDEFFWSYGIRNGNQTVTVIQPGQRTADTPQLTDAEISKDLEQYHEFTVRGALKRVAGEEFSGSTSFVGLAESSIRPGSESVVDPSDGTNFTLNEDYEINWEAGEIRIFAGGAMTVSTTYQITYRHDVTGTYTDPNAPAGFRSRTVDIPAVTSSRSAEQIAYVLVQVDGFNDPRWIADLTVPPSVTTFDVVDAIPLDRLDLPSNAGPLEIEEPPEVTPEGTQFRLGTRPELEARLSELRRITQQVARRSG